MEEKLVSFEVAMLAKENGFVVENSTKYSVLENSVEVEYLISQNMYQFHKDYVCFKATQSLLQRWLREEHNIMVSVITAYSGGFIDDKLVKSFKPSIEILNFIGKDIFTSDLKYNMFHGLKPMSYEEALELGLLDGLKLI